MNNLFVMCERCLEPNLVNEQLEQALPYIGYLKCCECDHMHEVTIDLISYAKVTGDYSGY